MVFTPARPRHGGEAWRRPDGLGKIGVRPGGVEARRRRPGGCAEARRRPGGRPGGEARRRPSGPRAVFGIVAETQGRRPLPVGGSGRHADPPTLADPAISGTFFDPKWSKKRFFGGQKMVQK